MMQANYVRVLCTYIQNYIYMCCIVRNVNISITRITRVLTSVLQESQTLVLAMISLHMLTFRFVVAIVASLIHNTLLGEIMISSI